MRKTMAIAVLAGSLLFALAGRSFAAGQKAAVKYVSASAIYLDEGSNAGIARGDTALVFRDGERVAILEVTYVAASTAACRLLDSFGEVKPGDQVTVTLSTASESPAREGSTLSMTPGAETSPDTSGTPGATPSAREPVLAAEPGQEAAKPRRAPRLSGHIGVQLMLQNDLEATNYDVTEPSLVARLRVVDILGPFTELNIRLRSRRVQRPADLSPDTPSEWVNRIYEVSFAYENPEARLSMRAGRVLSNRFAGIGALDGALGEMKLAPRISVGAFAGSQPDPASAHIGFDETKAGVYAAFEQGNWQSRRIASTLALAGRYNRGTVSQEFLYEQLQYSEGERLSLYQSGELNINRGWRRDVTGKALNLGNLLLNARYQVMRGVAVDLGYDNRTQVRTYESRDVPDSLFDDALRQGYRAGVRARLPRRLSAWLQGGLRTRQGDSETTRSLSGGVTQRDLLGSGIAATLQVNSFRNPFSSGIQPSISGSRYLFSALYLNLQLGQSRYTLAKGGGSVVYSWARGSTVWNVTRSIYTSLTGEAYRGDNLSSNRLYIEAGYRF